MYSGNGQGVEEGSTGNDNWAGSYYRPDAQHATSSTPPTDPGTPRERGARRKKLYAYLQAANEFRQSYVAGYAARSSDGIQSREINSEGWPEVATAHADGAELMLFPSYGRLRPPPSPEVRESVDLLDGTMHEEWKPTNQMNRDVDAHVQVDIRGWLYIPNPGQLNRKSRSAIWLARQMCGLPAESSVAESSSPEDVEYARQTAVEMGLSSREAGGGNFSGLDAQAEARLPYQRVNPSVSQPAMSPAEAKAAHTAFNSRLAPFTYRPIANAPITIFFYNENQSQSRQLLTSDNGHFSLRSDLDFIPTHVRVLATEYLSATEEVCLHPPDGISLISDIDDTVKHSAISQGARGMFKNTFTAPLQSLIIPGVSRWYRRLHSSPYNVSVHYVSNSPWQLYPVLRSFFQEAGLPPGSFHLKQYSGMLQGLFEPVGERKRGSIEKVIQDFPHRKWILVGDSGEQDLEIYTEMAERWPDKILAICIRDVTTSTPIPKAAATSGAPFFNPGYQNHPASYSTPTFKHHDLSGDLIDLSDGGDTSQSLPSERRPMVSPMPQRPRGSTTGSYPSTTLDQQESNKAPPPIPPRKPQSLRSPPIPPKPSSLGSRQSPPIDPFTGQPRPISRTTSYADSNNSTPSLGSVPSFNRAGSSNYERGDAHGPASNPPSGQSTPQSYLRRAATAMTTEGVGSAAGGLVSQLRASNLAGLAGMASAGATAAGKQEVETVVNKKEDLWRRRWESASERMGMIGVRLLSWKEGSDVEEETVKLVERELGIGRRGR